MDFEASSNLNMVVFISIHDQPIGLKVVTIDNLHLNLHVMQSGVRNPSAVESRFFFIPNL